jgi:hypothetical protein
MHKPRKIIVVAVTALPQKDNTLEHEVASMKRKIV